MWHNKMLPWCGHVAGDSGKGVLISSLPLSCGKTTLVPVLQIDVPEPVTEKGGESQPHTWRVSAILRTCQEDLPVVVGHGAVHSSPKAGKRMLMGLARNLKKVDKNIRTFVGSQRPAEL
jgi:hypothetical protein